MNSRKKELSNRAVYSCHLTMCLWLATALLLAALPASASSLNFTYNGFRSANLTLNGFATLTSSGLIELTNGSLQRTGHAFYPFPVKFKNSTNGTAASFSTSFVFAIVSEFGTRISAHGIAFVLGPTRGLPGGGSGPFLGLFNGTNEGNATNHVMAVELDTVQSREAGDIDNNHVGIDINTLRSEVSAPAAYFDNSVGRFSNISLFSGEPIRVWIEYDGFSKKMDVAVAPARLSKPERPLLSFSRDISSVLNENMFVGFSSSTGSIKVVHYLLGWSFSINDRAQELEISKLPKLPRIGPKKRSQLWTIGWPLLSVSLILLTASGIVYIIRRKRKFAEVVEDWEQEYGPHRFKFKDLYIATRGFRGQELLGSGGFGQVYRGTLPHSKLEIAVKRVSHESRQGMKEFVAEIVSLGRLRHRNLVPLLGYCRRKGELLLVYDFMQNGSLDKYIYENPRVTLRWRQRFRIIKGVALGLCYLHEEWEQVVIHRDVKASNVLLDGEFNGRLGDFGLARLYDHGTDPQTTHLVGTLGYLAPEHTRTGKATTSTDVFAFGVFLLEVGTGKRPIQPKGHGEDSVLLDWVFSLWLKGAILEASDAKLGADFVAEEVEMVLKLGLLCSHAEPQCRPTMRQVVQHLEGDVPLPDLSSLRLTSVGLTSADSGGFTNFATTLSYPTASSAFSSASVIADSLLSGGR